jgi:hypothetical protein
MSIFKYRIDCELNDQVALGGVQRISALVFLGRALWLRGFSDQALRIGSCLDVVAMDFAKSQ